MVEEEDQVRARGCGRRDEERLEAGLAGPAPKLLGRPPVGADKVVGPQAQPLEDGVIRKIQHPLEIDPDGCQHEGPKPPPSGRLADLGPADNGRFTAVEGSERALRVVAPAVEFAPLRAQSPVSEMPRHDPIKLPSQRSGGQAGEGL